MSTVKINNQIRATELRVISETGENLGLLSFKDALKRAEVAGLDLIEITGNTVPPIAKIADYGKFQYEQNKKLKDAKAKSHKTETKAVQVKVGTGEHDLMLKAKKTAEWLREGHRIKIELYLRGREKGTTKEFQKTRIERILALIPENFKIADDFKPGPKGLAVTIERDNTKK